AGTLAPSKGRPGSAAKGGGAKCSALPRYRRRDDPSLPPCTVRSQSPQISVAGVSRTDCRPALLRCVTFSLRGPQASPRRTSCPWFAVGDPPDHGYSGLQEQNP